MKESEKKFSAFSATGLPAWERAAREELQGADPWNKLTRELQGVSIKPFYSTNSPKNEPIQLPSSKGSFLGPRTWFNCPLVVVSDPVKANEVALDHLKHGAEGLLFELNEAVDFSLLLRSVEWPYCSLNFLAKKNSAAIAIGLANFLESAKAPTQGALFSTLADLPPSNGSFRFLGQLISSGATPMEDLANALVTVDHRLGASVRQHAMDVAFSIEVGTDFFLEAAKLRALRAVWQKLLKERGAEPAESPLFIHARSTAWTNEAYDPHGNMIKATTAAMSAILGGCDALTIDSVDSANAMMSRVARNVSNVLREESHFSLVADPLSGSYFIEDLTGQFTDQVWNMVRAKISP